MINKLYKAFSDNSYLNGYELVKRTVNAIRIITDSQMCTLWTINHNNTTNDFKSASLFVREMANNYEYIARKDEDYVHKLQNCFIDYVLSIDPDHKNRFYEFGIEKCTQHLSYDTLKDMGFNYFICIPIINNHKVLAFLKLSYINNPKFNNLFEVATSINSGISTVLLRYNQYEKQEVINKLISAYAQFNGLPFIDKLRIAICEVLQSSFEYEGASVFLWDSYSNRFNLAYTTGLQEQSSYTDIYYSKGEGLTGKVAIEKAPRIYDDLIELERTDNPFYLHKYKEETKHPGRTMLVIPIFRPSNPSNVLGIIRFTNKINRHSKLDNKTTVDYFNDNDVDLLDNACRYLALIIENYMAEEERNDFISKFSHESKTPANAIKVTADRIIRKLTDERFMRFQLPHYLQSILDYADLQLMQANTNLYVSKFNGRSTKSQRYKIRCYSLKEIIKDSINVVRPFAREHGVIFDNIRIDAKFPDINLYIDKSAYITIFYNLLTNAIKYIKTADDFYVEITASESYDGCYIQITDYGIGINEKDKDRIFLLGVRSENAQKTNSEGYGIGLHVVNQILRDFGGKISVKQCSNPTIFEIKLPHLLYSNNYLNSKEWKQ